MKAKNACHKIAHIRIYSDVTRKFLRKTSPKMLGDSGVFNDMKLCHQILLFMMFYGYGI